MQGRFEFDGDAVLTLVEEARAARERVWTEAQRYVAAGVDLSGGAELAEEPELPDTGAPPGLWLMNDRGVYLRSNAQRRPEESMAHARGYRAEVQVGDEPICEFIDAAPLAQLRPDDTLVVTLSEQKLALSLIRPA